MNPERSASSRAERDTVSAEPGSEGSLIELYGNTRFLADGDEVVLRATKLGEVRGRALPG